MFETDERSTIRRDRGDDGIDALTLGPADLAQDLGVARESRKGQGARRKTGGQILAAAKKHGKIARCWSAA